MNCLKGSKDIKKIALAEKNYIDKSYNTLSSRKSAYSAYRKVIAESTIPAEMKDDIKNIFKLSGIRIDNRPSEYEIYKKDYQNSVASENKKLKEIFDYQGLIIKANSLITHNNFIDKVLGFAALTGRRVAEIGCTAEFSLDSPNHLLFKGQLKTRGTKELEHSFRMPCLIDNIEFYKQFKDFRNKFSTYLNKPTAFHNCSKDLSIYVKKHFSDFVSGDIKAKDLRAIYSTICVMLYKPENQSEASYKCEILGHREDDLNTGHSYSDYFIKKDS